MNNLQEWLQELIKYMDIIQQADHLRVRQTAANFDQTLFEVELVQLQNQVNACLLTRMGSPHNAALRAGRTLFESRLSEADINREIAAARVFLDDKLKAVTEAARNGMTTLV